MDLYSPNNTWSSNFWHCDSKAPEQKQSQSSNFSQNRPPLLNSCKEYRSDGSVLNLATTPMYLCCIFLFVLLFNASTVYCDSWMTESNFLVHSSDAFVRQQVPAFVQISADYWDAYAKHRRDYCRKVVCQSEDRGSIGIDKMFVDWERKKITSAVMKGIENGPKKLASIADKSKAFREDPSFLSFSLGEDSPSDMTVKERLANLSKRPTNTEGMIKWIVTDALVNKLFESKKDMLKEMKKKSRML